MTAQNVGLGPTTKQDLADWFWKECRRDTRLMESEYGDRVKQVLTTPLPADADKYDIEGIPVSISTCKARKIAQEIRKSPEERADYWAEIMERLCDMIDAQEIKNGRSTTEPADQPQEPAVEADGGEGR